MIIIFFVLVSSIIVLAGNPAERITPVTPDNITDFESETGCTPTTHWDCVDDDTSDGPSSFVQCVLDTGGLYEFYNTNASFTEGVHNIKNVTVYYSACDEGQGFSQACVNVSGTAYCDGTDDDPSGCDTYSLYSHFWDDSPATASEWTVDEVNNMLIGVQGTDCKKDVHVSQVYAEIGWETPTVYPKWYDNQSSTPSIYNPNILSEFNITWNITTGDIDTVFIEGNWSSCQNNCSMTNTTYGGSIYNYSEVLPAGTWYWKSYANDTDDEWNSSDTWYFTISKNTSATATVSIPAGNGTYPHSTTTTCTETNPEASGNLYRNESLANSENNSAITLAADTHDYICNVTSANYTTASDSSILIISQGSTNISLYLNDTETNKTYNLNEVANFTAQINITGLDVSLVSDYPGWVIQTDTTTIYNYTTLTTGGTNYNITANFSGNQNYSSFQRTFFFNVTDNYPYWSNEDRSVANQSEYTPIRNYGFQIDWDDDGGISEVVFEWEGSNYSYLLGEVSNSGNTYWYNVTNIGAGNYIYKWYANDTSDQWNSTSSITYVVQQNQTNPVDLYLNGTQNDNKTYTYPEAVNATGDNSYPNSGSALLWRDGESKSNPEEILLGNATYLYKANTSGNTNYTANDTGVEFYAFVNKGTVTLNLYLNDSESNQTYTYPEAINATGLKSTTLNNEGNLSLWRQDSIINTSLTLDQLQENILLGNGTYNYTLTFTATNYSDNSITTNRFALVNKGDVNTFLTISPGNTTYPTQTTTSCSDDSPEGAAGLYRNQSDASSENNTAITLGANTHEYICNISTSENYSSATNLSILIISQNTTTSQYLNLTINDTESNKNYQYANKSNVTTWNSIPELTFTMYLNYSADSSDNNTVVTKGAGLYVYEYNTSGNTNYSSASKQYNLT